MERWEWNQCLVSKWKRQITTRIIVFFFFPFVVLHIMKMKQKQNKEFQGKSRKSFRKSPAHGCTLKVWFGLNIAIKPEKKKRHKSLVGSCHCSLLYRQLQDYSLKDIFLLLCPVKIERCPGMRFLPIPLSDYSLVSYISPFGRFSCCSAYIFRFLISSYYLWLWPQLIKVLQCMLKFRYVLKLRWNHVCQCFAELMDMSMCLSTVLNWDHASSEILIPLLHIFKPLPFLCLIID